MQWVVLGPGGAAVARAVVEAPDAKCPALALDGGAPRPMQLRFAGAGAMPVTICEERLPAGARSAAVGGAAAASPPERGRPAPRRPPPRKSPGGRLLEQKN